MIIDVSVVIPVYNSDNSLFELTTRLMKTLITTNNSFEIILVDDGSQDTSWQSIVEISGKQRNVKGIRLSRNFGQHAAIRCGLESAKGRYIVVMDCDLQDVPEYVAELLREIKKGFDYVIAHRNIQFSSFPRRAMSMLFYSVYRLLTHSSYSHEFGNFGVYSRKVVDAILKFKEKNQSFGLLVSWTGFHKGVINVQRPERKYGQSSYSFGKLLTFALNTLISYSNRLLYAILTLGIIFALAAVAAAFFVFSRYLIFGITVAGWTSSILISLILGSMTLLSIGIVGIYISKVFEEIKERPIFLISDVTN